MGALSAAANEAGNTRYNRYLLSGSSRRERGGSVPCFGYKWAETETDGAFPALVAVFRGGVAITRGNNWWIAWVSAGRSSRTQTSGWLRWEC